MDRSVLEHIVAQNGFARRLTLCASFATVACEPRKQ
jgi:hypothetical protein